MIGVVQFTLLRKSKINKTKTAAAVKSFFVNELNHYLNLANKHLSDISSPTLDPNNVGGHDVRNYTDETIIVNLDTENCVKAVDHTISNCTYPSGTILYLYFIKKIPDNKIAERIGYQSSRYYDFKKAALVEFAERLDYWRQVDHASIDDLRDFDDVKVI